MIHVAHIHVCSLFTCADNGVVETGIQCQDGGGEVGADEADARCGRHTGGALRVCSKGKPFFGGDSAGYLDVVLGGLLPWLQGTEALCGVEFLDAARTPLLSAWAERFGALDAAKAVLPDVGRLVEFAKVRRAQQAAGAQAAAAKN